MEFPDPVGLKYEKPREIIVFGASQLVGGRKRQEDSFANFNDECFALADGVGTLPNADVASQLAADTAVWAYKHVRQRHYYWASKRDFLKRIVRTTNMTLWQKQRETGFGDGMATTLLVLIVGDRSVWLGNVGDAAAYLFRDGNVKKLTKEDADAAGNLTNVLGKQRLGIVPSVTTDDLEFNEAMLLATDGVTRYVDESDICSVLASCGRTTESLTDAAATIVSRAQANGSTDNMTAVVIKRVFNLENIV